MNEQRGKRSFGKRKIVWMTGGSLTLVILAVLVAYQAAPSGKTLPPAAPGVIRITISYSNDGGPPQAQSQTQVFTRADGTPVKI